jgi:hypothetical protein
MAQPVADPVLVTFPPSLDSELSRFLVQHYGIQHEEQRHALGYVFLVTLRHGFTVIFPLLYSDSFRLVGPRSIANYFDTRCASEFRLFPADKTEMQQVESDWTQFNNTLAFATARFALAFSVAAAPVVLPPTYGGPIPSFDEMPGEIQTVINEMKSRAAGIFALRIYREYRSIFGVGSV